MGSMEVPVREDFSGDVTGTVSGDVTGTVSGTIGSGATITDGANSHGWEHIKTIAYEADTATSSTGTTATKMSNVVSSKYSAYKLIIQWGAYRSGQDLYLRFLDTGGSVATAASYFYSYQYVSHSGAEGNGHNGSSVTYAMVGNDLGQGSLGFNGEISLFNCFNGQSNFPTIDGQQLKHNNRSSAYHPTGYIRHHSYDVGNYYQGGSGMLAYNADLYVSGFCLYFEGDDPVGRDSFWSCYGLKSPTAD